MNIFKRLPELQFLILITIGCYIFLEVFVKSNILDGDLGFSGVDIVFISFVLSFLVAILSGALMVFSIADYKNVILIKYINKKIDV